jgi:hypothetical protein
MTLITCSSFSANVWRPNMTKIKGVVRGCGDNRFELGKVHFLQNSILRFIDSYQFLSAGLDNFLQNMAKELFCHSRKHLGDNDLLLAKGIFPYEWCDCFEKFNETELPSMDAFYNELDKEGVSDEQYDRAQAIWTTFNCRTFKDYHDLYLKTDVILLAVAFENFRNVSMSTNGLDPAHYLTTPSLTWQGIF